MNSQSQQKHDLALGQTCQQKVTRWVNKKPLAELFHEMRPGILNGNFGNLLPYWGKKRKWCWWFQKIGEETTCKSVFSQISADQDTLELSLSDRCSQNSHMWKRKYLFPQNHNFQSPWVTFYCWCARNPNHKTNFTWIKTSHFFTDSDAPCIEYLPTFGLDLR